jgi:hypothetical protein
MATPARIFRFIGLLTFCSFALSSLAEEYDCRTGQPSGVSFEYVFGRIGDGLDYTETGEIIRSPGKKLTLNAQTKVAFFHYVARNNPTISDVPMNVICSSCLGKGGRRYVQRNEKDILDLGYTVDEKCATCSGKGSAMRYVSLTVTYSGQLPKMPDSPLVRDFKTKLGYANEGSSSAQLDVAARFLSGRGTEKSTESAREWYTKAALQGERAALAALSELYIDPANTAFHDYAFGLALSAVADPSVALQETPDFNSFSDTVNVSTTAELALSRRLQLLEAGFLAPRIAKGLSDKDKAKAEKVLSPKALREGFPPQGSVVSTPADKRGLFLRGVMRYLGLGYPVADRQEALRSIEASACLVDPEAWLFIAMHFDSAKEYPASKPTAWAFYTVAKNLGSKDPFCIARLNQLAEDEVSVDWAGSSDSILAGLQQGRITPAVIQGLADLSLYRSIPSASASGSSALFDTAATQEKPLTKTKVISHAQSLLRSKLKVIEVSSEGECAFRKCWDDGSVRFYSVSGLVAFTNVSSVRETAPFTVCFKITDASSAPVLLYLSAGSSHVGEYPVECISRP